MLAAECSCTLERAGVPTGCDELAVVNATEANATVCVPSGVPTTPISADDHDTFRQCLADGTLSTERACSEATFRVFDATGCRKACAEQLGALEERRVKFCKDVTASDVCFATPAPCPDGGGAAPAPDPAAAASLPPLLLDPELLGDGAASVHASGACTRAVCAVRVDSGFPVQSSTTTCVAWLCCGCAMSPSRRAPGTARPPCAIGSTWCSGAAHNTYRPVLQTPRWQRPHLRALERMPSQRGGPSRMQRRVVSAARRRLAWAQSWEGCPQRRSPRSPLLRPRSWRCACGAAAAAHA